MARVRARKPKKQKPSGVTIRQNKDGSFKASSYGPNAPDLRDVLPGLFPGLAKKEKS